jgi:hypothetical protein
MATLSAGARELVLYADNDGDLYRGPYTSILKQLVRRKVKGEYDSTLAAKAFKGFADIAAQKYAKEHGDKASDWFRIFPPRDREEAAREWRDEFEVEYKLGNYSHHAPAKYAHLAPVAKHKKSGGGAHAKHASTTERARTFATASHRSGCDCAACRWVPRQPAERAHEPKPKFEIGDKVKVMGGPRGNSVVLRGTVSFNSGWDDFLGQYRYKVLDPKSGTRINYNENSLRHVR